MNMLNNEYENMKMIKQWNGGYQKIHLAHPNK